MNWLTYNIFHLRYLAQASVNIPGNGSTSNSYSTGLPTVSANNGDVQTILQITFAAIGSIALIIVIFSAIQFITSGGNPQQTAKARNTLIYAAVGLVIALSAEVIVTFVLNNV
jgi:hypothetical protein